jgi:hypothetical protein
MRRIGLALFFLFVFCTSGLATDYYVKTPANGGIDSNSGLDWTNAKATIGAAMALVNGSDNVHVAAGTYNERVSFHASNSNQLLGGYPAAGGGTRNPSANPAIIDGTGLPGTLVYIPGDFVNSRGYNGIVIDGLTIRNGSKNGAYGAGIETYTVGLTIKNCIIENNTSAGSGWVGGVYAGALFNEFSTRLLRIEACIIRNNTGPGAGAILIDAIAPFQLQLVNNLIYGNSSSDTGTFLFGAGGVVIGTGSQYMATPPNEPKIINCTIANNTAAHPTTQVGGLAVNLDYGETVTVANSIIWHAGRDDILAYNGETVTLSYSDVEDSGDTGTGVIHTNPSFVSGSDYHLGPASPCLDMGNNGVSGLPATDLEGNNRVLDWDGNGTATVDMGAYEKTAPADTTPPTGSIVINGGDPRTNTTGVALTLSAADPAGVTHMCVSNTDSCSSWETYATSKPWTLVSGDGSKTVYALFRDGLGNENTTPYSGSITLDATDPVDGTLSAAPGDTEVSLSWSGFSDATSGIAGYALVFSTTGTPNSCSEGTEIYAGTAAAFVHTGLTNGTAYNYRVCAADNAGNISMGATASATPVVDLPDTDTDGVPDDEEKGPNGNNVAYDGNGDGTPDSQQENVASLHTFDGLNYVTVASPNGTTLSSVAAIENPSPGDSPAGVTFPYGFFEFVVSGVDAGGATTVTLHLPAGANPTTYFKYGSTLDNGAPHWYEFLFDGTTGAVIDGDVVTLYFVDGQRGDDDLAADGVIIDPGGPGISQTAIVPGYKNFGSVNADSTASQVFTLSNNGTTNLEISLIELTGGDAGAFRLATKGNSACSSLTPILLPGESCAFIVKFAPDSEGERTTTLRISSNDPASPADIRLDGTGTVQSVFDDCQEDHWAEDFINTLYYSGITGGCSGTSYCPDNPVTRAQMAVFIISAMGETPSTEAYNAYFDDIANDGFAPFINRMNELGITGGCRDRAYCPNDLLTRQQMAVFIILAMGETGSTATYNANFDDIGDDGFAGFINRMNELGITGGCGGRAYCPGDSTNRAMMAVFLVTAF